MYKVNDDIYWTGYIDWNLRSFHGYITPGGSTYNAYVIKDEKPTIIDTVKHYGFDEMLTRIKEVIDPKAIRYIISNHTEMDHSGTIDRLVALCPQAEVVCSPKGEEHLRRHFKKDWKFKVVQSGDVLDIGKRKLTFLLTPMVHWPDNMVTYSPQDRILFSNDAFGQHHASTERFADELGIDFVLHEAAKYYANIVLPYGPQVLKALEDARPLAIETICPSHGLIWRRKEDIARLMSGYRAWASGESEKRVVIVYDTMWKTTETMAHRLYELLFNANIPTKLVSLQHTDISDVITEILFSKVMLCGTPILNNRMVPPMAAFLMYLKGLRPKNRAAMTFGSYGWATVGFKEFEASIVEAGFELLGPGLYKKFIPDEAELNELQDIVEKVKQKLA